MKNSAKHIADRIRLMIATKQFQVGELLPSTRELGRQLEVSFHTVRKAYRHLEDEGLITGEQGRGFVVDRQNTSLDKSERLEIGAEKLKNVMEELIGYGLDESEIETLFAEQVSFLEWPDRIQSCATIGETRELATILSSSIRSRVGVKSDTLSLEDYEQALTYDALFIPIQLVSEFHNVRDSIRIMPVVYHFDADLLISIVARAALGRHRTCDGRGKIDSENYQSAKNFHQFYRFVCSRCNLRQVTAPVCQKYRHSCVYSGLRAPCGTESARE
jgi:GntR family transcriptional regulator